MVEAHLRKYLAEKEKTDREAVGLPSETPKTDKLYGSIREEIERYLKNVIKLPYSSHDFTHSLKLEELASFLVPPTLLEAFSWDELYLLVLALWLHDGGMVPDHDNQSIEEVRKHHHKRIFNRIETKIFSFTNEPGVRRALAIICRSHCLNHSEFFRLQGTSSLGTKPMLRPKLLSSILRLCDICHVTSDRTPQYVFDRFVFNSVSKSHWETHLSVDGIARRDIGAHPIALQASYKGEDDLSRLNGLADSIDDELRLTKQVFAASGWQIYDFVERNFIETIPKWKTIDVPAPEICALLCEHIYQSLDVFVRELVQNCLDACKIRSRVSQKDHIHYEPYIKVVLYYDKQVEGGPQPIAVKVYDNGIGMDQTDVENFFLQVGAGIVHSKRVQELLESTNDSLIAKFGIGFLANLRLAHRIVVETHKRNFSPLRIEFPDYSGEYAEFERRQVQVDRLEGQQSDLLLYGGTSVIIYLNTQGRDVLISESVKKFCRHTKVPISYEERARNGEIPHWNDKGKAAHEVDAVSSPYLGEEASSFHRLELTYEEHGVQGVIGYFPQDPENHLFLCQEGIFVADRLDLIPQNFVGYRGEVNLPAGMIELTASRSDVKLDSKYSTLQHDLNRLFNLLLQKVLSNYPIHINPRYGEDKHPLIYQLNRLFNSCASEEDYKQFFAETESHLHVLDGDFQEVSLGDLRERWTGKGTTKVYHLIEHRHYYDLVERLDIEGYWVGIAPRLVRALGESFKRSGELCFTTYQIGANTSEELYETQFFRRDIYDKYWETHGYEVEVCEPKYADEMARHSQDSDIKKADEFIRSLGFGNNISCCKSDLRIRCLFAMGGKRYINLLHKDVGSVIAKLQEEFREVGPELREITRTYIKLLCLDVSDTVAALEKMILQHTNLETKENSNDAIDGDC